MVRKGEGRPNMSSLSRGYASPCLSMTSDSPSTWPMRNNELPLKQDEETSAVGTELLGILSTDRIHYGLFRRVIWRSVGIRTVPSPKPRLRRPIPQQTFLPRSCRQMVTTWMSCLRKLSTDEASCAAHHYMLPPRTGGRIFRWDKYGQCDDRRPLPLFPDGRLGHIQRLDDLSTHLEDLFPLFPCDIGIELHT